jgi:hypothetical protein
LSIQPAIELLCIEPGYITRQIWPTARDMIRRAIERTNLSDFEAVERDVLQGRALLWLAWNGERIEAACTTELTIAQGRKACVVVACSGKNHRRWLPLLAKIEDYARAENCACMRVIGRKRLGTESYTAISLQMGDPRKGPYCRWEARVKRRSRPAAARKPWDAAMPTVNGLFGQLNGLLPNTSA